MTFGILATQQHATSIGRNLVRPGSSQNGSLRQRLLGMSAPWLLLESRPTQHGQARLVTTPIAWHQWALGFRGEADSLEPELQHSVLAAVLQELTAQQQNAAKHFHFSRAVGAKRDHHQDHPLSEAKEASTRGGAHRLCPMQCRWRT